MTAQTTAEENMYVDMHVCAHIITPTRVVTLITLSTQFPAKLGKEIRVSLDDLVKGFAQVSLIPASFTLQMMPMLLALCCITTFIFLHDVSLLPGESSPRILFKDQQSADTLFTKS